MNLHENIRGLLKRPSYHKLHWIKLDLTINHGGGVNIVFMCNKLDYCYSDVNERDVYEICLRNSIR